MRYSTLTQRIAGHAAAAWDIHYQALEQRRQGREIFLLSVGDPDFDTPAPVVEAAVASLRRGETHYSDVRGSLALRQAVARHCQLADPERVVVTAGAQCGLFATCQCLFEADDEVIVAEPMYVTYQTVFGACGARAVQVPVRPEQGFRLDPAEVARAITPRTRGLLLNSPHNPTGTVIGLADLKCLARLCQEYDLWLICDDVYQSLLYDGEAANPLGLPGMTERCVSIGSLSKSHAMSGWRVGWVIGPPEFARHLGNLVMSMLFGLPEFVMQAACVALEEGRDDLLRMRDAYRERCDRVCAVLEECPGIHVHRPAGGMFVMLDIRGTGLDAQAFAQRLLDEEGMAVLPGDGFGPSAAGHVRMGLVLDAQLLEHLCRRIIACVRRLADGFNVAGDLEYGPGLDGTMRQGLIDLTAR
ncbi:pyridoxal phosphate-dependent aminotransferase [Pseudomonas sp. BJa3]|uniref:pyridoxal phosphate-dependent aminotransferase n=1 Tax=Pseudomonas sp. BJa3 TaxID=2986525 RepID=UPI002265BDE4|nr:aminotransferase class I/II-fold pyridoxal phosphate-dependent enzyme [Pseudomonas sp. BJa3]